MRIIKSNQRKFFTAYGIACQDLFDNLTENKPPFFSKRCVVKPGQTSALHQHHEIECFFICEGHGVISIDTETQRVVAGDVLQIPAFNTHEITNTDPHRNLVFVTFWWENFSRPVELPASARQQKETLIFSTPPTPNGDLHLGHLSGPYLGADFFKRFLTLKGITAHHVTGRDDHQSYVVLKGLQTQQTPKDIADLYADKIEQTLKAADICLSHFARPARSAYHQKLTQQVFLLLYQKGVIYSKEVDSLFCKTTNQYLFEAHVRGQCPHCGAEADGNACEQCGRPNDCVDLINPVSKFSNDGNVEIRKTKRLFFRFSQFSNELTDYLRRVILPAHVRVLCEKMLATGLPDIAVAHYTDWGISVPFHQSIPQKIYVWFEMALGYLAAAQELYDMNHPGNTIPNAWEYFYKNPACEVTHFFGFDNSYYHALLIPAVYMALDSKICLPKKFVVNEMLNLDNKKFSTSRNHLIAGRELLSSYPSDYVRYYLAYVRPETEKTNFTMAAFTDTIRQQLLDKWQPWLQTLLKQMEQNFSNIIPATNAWSNEQRDFWLRLQELFKSAEHAYQADFSPQRICRLANDLVHEATRFNHSMAHYSTIETHINFDKTAMVLQITAAMTLARIIAPIMPRFSQVLWNTLQGKPDQINWPSILSFPEPGTQIVKPSEELFMALPICKHQ